MKAIALIFSLYSLNAFATQYTGTIKGTNESCYLTIENSYYDGAEDKKNLRINVEVSFPDDHHHDEMEQFQITLAPAQLANIYAGLGVNGQDKLNVGSSSVTEFIPQMYSFRWLHGSHFHNLQCLNLVLSK